MQIHRQRRPKPVGNAKQLMFFREAQKHGKIINALVFVAISLFLVGCAGSGSRATCFDCTTTPQSWSEFGFEKLEGTWRGTQAITINDAAAAKLQAKTEKVEVTFLDGTKFLRAYNLSNSTCAGFPEKSIVLIHELWWDRGSARKDGARAFDVFSKIDQDEVLFGRAYVSRSKGESHCEYVTSGKQIAMNRLALPAVAYSKRLTPDGRALASGGTTEVDINFEFLNFAGAKNAADYRWQGKEKEAPLFFRFVKTTRVAEGAFDQGEWQGTEERVFRLWRADLPAEKATASSDSARSPATKQ